MAWLTQAACQAPRELERQEQELELLLRQWAEVLLACPHEARDIIDEVELVGLTRASTKAHLARAALEAVCFQTKEVMDCMVASSNIAVTELRVDGGITANSACMQLQANIMGVSVILPRVTETTALGAAFAAGVAVGLWSGVDELKSLWQEQKRWVADAEDVGVVSDVPLDKSACERRRAEGYRMWQRAVERSKDWCD